MDPNPEQQGMIAFAIAGGLLELLVLKQIVEAAEVNDFLDRAAGQLAKDGRVGRKGVSVLLLELVEAVKQMQKI
jgi:hypothetical protein